MWNRTVHTLSDTAYLASHRAVAIAFALGVRVWHQRMHPGLENFSRAVYVELDRRFRKLLKQDLANAKQGVYPRELLMDMATLKGYLSNVPAGLREMPRVLKRARNQGFDDLPASVDGADYPSYYLRTFHWQTDGWFSEHSARMYDMGVEFLFMGTADVMRRMTFAPLVNAAADIDHPKIVDIGCGNGRYLGQLQRAVPHAQLTGVDLSPSYINVARRNFAGHPSMSWIEANGEDMPLQDDAFDMATSVFLFHELPKQARRNVMREAFRVLAPGGLFVVCDSGQQAGNQAMQDVFDVFPRLYHEPYYKGYFRDDLAVALQDSGFSVLSAKNHFFSRIVVARKGVSTGA